MTIVEAIKKFEWLAMLCPYLVPTEEQRTKMMLEMFRLDIALVIESGEDSLPLLLIAFNVLLRLNTTLTSSRRWKTSCLKTKESKVNRVETGVTATKIWVNKVVSCKDITKTVIRGKGIIRLIETHDSRHLRRATLPTWHAGNAEKITSRNVDKGLSMLQAR